jgi:hypothetical protein
MRGSIGSLERATDDDVARTASRVALVVLFGGWLSALVAYFDAFLDAATKTTLVVPHHAVASFLMPNASGGGYSATALVALTLPLAVLLAITRIGLPVPDRDTLGALAGALIVMVDVAMLGNRHEFVQSRELAPLLAAMICVCALRIIITAALRRWNVLARAG